VRHLHCTKLPQAGFISDKISTGLPAHGHRASQQRRQH
jgi:hypothetical protein